VAAVEELTVAVMTNGGNGWKSGFTSITQLARLQSVHIQLV
jgi:hypothetical protein